MGVISVSLPPNLPANVAENLELVTMTGGPDSMPTVCQVHVSPSQITIIKNTEESGAIIAPWEVPGAGHLLFQTATLIERQAAYSLPLELARGKINQLRNQSSDWLLGGLYMPADLVNLIKESTLAFTRAVVRGQSEEAYQYAQKALVLGCEASDELIHAYTDQVFQVRHQRQARLDTLLGCRLGASVPSGDSAAALTESCNAVSISYSIHETAPAEGDYQWEDHDRVLEWAQGENLIVNGGPLVDFSGPRIPSWLWLWDRDRGKIAKLLCEYTADVLERYQDRISTWQLTAGSNIPGVLSLNDDELLWLTAQMVETANRVAPSAHLNVGIAQPWGDYMREAERMYSPFVFADTLLRSGIRVAALDLEIVMTIAPRGSYCRDLLDLSRLLDLYALLGVPLNVTLGYPAETDDDELADSDLSVSAGHWRDGVSLQTQSDWAYETASLCLCKPQIRSVQWVHYSDSRRHQFPHCGLLDSSDVPRDVLKRWKELREKHLF